MRFLAAFAVLMMVFPAPSSAERHGRARWVRCASRQGRFSVRLPGRAVRGEHWIEGPDKKPARMWTVSGERAEASYVAACTDYGRASRSMSRAALQAKVCRGVLDVARAVLVRQRPVRYRGR